MKVNIIELTNFRNISHQTYALGDANCIESKNHTGKTNTIQALYWVFTGKLLDGSSNDMSLKPIGKTREKVSVKITFTTDSGKTHSIERTYQEHWTKTRGSDEETLTGHDTKFFIDELEQKKNNEALEEIKALVGIDDNDAYKKVDFDPLQAIMNPQYLGEILEWKNLRQIIISIIGDVNNEEVFVSNESTKVARQTLETYDYKVDKAILFCDQQTKAAQDKIVELEAQVDYIEKTSEDIPSNELALIQEEMKNYTNEIYNLENSKEAENPLINSLKKEIQSLESQKNDEYLKSNQEYSNAVKEKNENLEKLQNDSRIAQERYSNLSKLVYDKKIELNIATIKLNDIDNQINNNNSKLNDLRNLYKVIKTEEFKVTREIICQNCGAVVNQKEIEEDRAKFEATKKQKLDENISLGKLTKLDNDNLLKKKQDVQTEIVKLESDLSSLENDEKIALDELNRANDNLKNSQSSNKVEFKYTDNYFKISELINQKRKELLDIENAPNDKNLVTQSKIIELQKKIEQLKEKEAQHYVYKNNIENVEKLKANIKVLSRNKVQYEIVKAACQQFNRTKLDILTKRLEQHFGTEVKFILVEENLKAGSWNNVCYPLIVGTNTPYKNGSTSEKVMTGIKIIEIFKRELKLPNLPILIDEIGELDSESISHLKSFTNAQILATRVNDAFEQPTIKVI